MNEFIGRILYLFYKLKHSFDDSKSDKGYGNYFTRALCRFREHPCGVRWYSSGMEPDMRCNGCGEDLG